MAWFQGVKEGIARWFQEFDSPGETDTAPFEWDSPSSSASMFGDETQACHGTSINPANGLPMIGCVDVEGNPYGCNFSDSFDNSWSDTSSSSLFEDYGSSSGIGFNND